MDLIANDFARARFRLFRLDCGASINQPGAQELTSMPQAASQISDIASDAVRRYDDLKSEIAAIVQTAMPHLHQR